MKVSDIQTLLVDASWYAGAIDGDAGSATWAAVAKAELLQNQNYRSAPARWPVRRRLIGAAQAALSVMGFAPGQIDGVTGNNTRDALAEWRIYKDNVESKIARTLIEPLSSHSSQNHYPLQRNMETFYGPAGDVKCTAGKVDLAYPMLLAWDRGEKINRFSCHEKLAAPLTDIFRSTLKHYGQAEIERLELDVFGGCFNLRLKRGGASLSTHAYGAAVDLNPEKNQLKWGADRAQFAGPDYVPFWNIVVGHGATPAGYAWGRDWMHFQFARL